MGFAFYTDLRFYILSSLISNRVRMDYKFFKGQKEAPSSCQLLFSKQTHIWVLSLWYPSQPILSLGDTENWGLGF